MRRCSVSVFSDDPNGERFDLVVYPSRRAFLRASLKRFNFSQRRNKACYVSYRDVSDGNFGALMFYEEHFTAPVVAHELIHAYLHWAHEKKLSVRFGSPFEEHMAGFVESCTREIMEWGEKAL